MYGGRAKSSKTRSISSLLYPYIQIPHHVLDAAHFELGLALLFVDELAGELLRLGERNGLQMVLMAGPKVEAALAAQAERALLLDAFGVEGQPAPDHARPVPLFEVKARLLVRGGDKN
jgi:hypothetical protein